MSMSPEVMEIEGFVTEARGGMYIVRDEAFNEWLCRTYRGTRTDNGPSSLVTVGDLVRIKATSQEDEHEGVIVFVYPRQSALVRKRDIRRNRSKEKIQVIASNIDQLCVVVSADDPPLNLRLIDRYLVFAGSEQMPVLIIINKTDLARQKELEEEMRVYADLGYPLCYVSAESGEGIEALLDLLSGKISAFSGHSGVGKSTLINRLIGEERLKTAEISAGNSRGVHTTTNAVMLSLPGGGYVIDTPGIREFNLSGVTSENLRFWFPEFLESMGNCAYSSCSHTVEPGCGVAQAVEEGRIDARRYESYLAIFDTLDDE